MLVIIGLVFRVVDQLIVAIRFHRVEVEGTNPRWDLDGPKFPANGRPEELVDFGTTGIGGFLEEVIQPLPLQCDTLDLRRGGVEGKFW